MKERLVFSLLALSTVGSFITATATVLVLKPDDKISIARGFILSILGFIFFLSLFDFLNHVLLKTSSGLRWKNKYHLTIGEVLDISNKAVSAIQAALSCLTGAIVCLWSCTRDFLHSSHFMSEAYAWFGAAYFFYDIWSMYKVHICMSIEKPINKDKCLKSKSLEDNSNIYTISFLGYCKSEPVILMHHLFIGCFGFLVVVYLRGGLGDCVFGFVYLMELSTPFVSMRGILSRMKLKSTHLYEWNGIAMLLTFFICRILMMPYVCYLYSRMIGLSYFEAIKTLPTGCKVSITILLIPQVYWFYLMMSGAYKVFFKNPIKADPYIPCSGTIATKNR